MTSVFHENINSLEHLEMELTSDSFGGDCISPYDEHDVVQFQALINACYSETGIEL